MMYLGDFPAGATVYLPFNTSAADGSSITIATDGTLKVYRLPSLTQRTSAAGITFSEDFDAITGRHLAALATADDTDVGFYAAGNDFGVARDAMTIDGKTVNAWLGLFSIENRSALRPTTPNRTLDVFSDGSVTATSVSAPTPAEIANEVQTRTIAGVGAVGIVNDVAALVVTKNWAAASRSLTSYGTLVADVVAAVAAAGAGGATPTAIAAAVWAKVIETQGSITAQQALDIILAVVAGVTSNAGLTFKSPDGGPTRLAATVNTANERLTITLTPSA